MRTRKDGTVPHGVGGYKNYGCRCPTCTGEYQVYRRAARARAIERARRLPQYVKHGLSAYSEVNCRCEVCRTAASVYWRRSYAEARRAR